MSHWSADPKMRRKLAGRRRPTRLRSKPAMAINVDALFDWVPPGDGDPPKYAAVRAAAIQFARAIAQYCPDGADARTAVFKVREAWFFANESVQRKGGG